MKVGDIVKCWGASPKKILAIIIKIDDPSSSYWTMDENGDIGIFGPYELDLVYAS